MHPHGLWYFIGAPSLTGSDWEHFTAKRRHCHAVTVPSGFRMLTLSTASDAVGFMRRYGIGFSWRTVAGDYDGVEFFFDSRDCLRSLAHDTFLDWWQNTGCVWRVDGVTALLIR